MLGDSLRRRTVPPGSTPTQRPPRPSPSRRASFTWGRWLIAALVILLGSFATGYLISTQILFPTPDTAGSGVPVPDLYGMEREGAEGTLTKAGLGVGRVRSQASMDVPVGRVIAQSPVHGQQLRPGAAVELTLSGGPPELRVAPVHGLGAGAARELLEDAGFTVQVAQVPAQVPAGTVARTDPVPGTALRLPATITLFVSLGPPQIDPAQVAPPTGGP